MPDRTSPSPAHLLLQIGAIGIEQGEPFTFASGLTSPMYCDNRLFLSRPAERKEIVERLCALIEELAGDEWDAVAGVASSGIPFAAWIVARFDKPMVYVRPAEKDHGRKRQVEGGLAAGKRVALVEDLVTTGGSAVAAVSALRDAGYVCNYCVSIFDYGFAAASEAFRENGIEHKTLTDFDRVVPVLHERGQASDADVERLKRWHEHADASGVAVSA